MANFLGFRKFGINTECWWSWPTTRPHVMQALLARYTTWTGLYFAVIDKVFPAASKKQNWCCFLCHVSTWLALERHFICSTNPLVNALCKNSKLSCCMCSYAVAKSVWVFENFEYQSNIFILIFILIWIRKFSNIRCSANIQTNLSIISGSAGPNANVCPLSCYLAHSCLVEFSLWGKPSERST